MSPTEVRVRAAAIEANARRLVGLAQPAELCAVVKADGYGHGAVVAARAALAGGATWLAVATAEEALELVESVPGDAAVMVLSEFAPQHLERAVALCGDRVRFTVASADGVARLASAEASRNSALSDSAEPNGALTETHRRAAAQGEHAGDTAEPNGAVTETRRRVHLKVDTGMHRMGVPFYDVKEAASALRANARWLCLEGVWTHLAVADEPANPFTREQLQRFDRALAELRADALPNGVVHAANSAGLLAHPDARRDMVRAGISLYGVPPSPELAGIIELEPALSLISRVTAVRTVGPGAGVSYGHSWRAYAATRIATVPIGYADGVRRDSGAAGVEVLVRGRRCRIVGAVTMDQSMIALPESISEEVAVGDEVVLIGSQGNDRITATEIAQRLGTIAYEVLTSISSRVPRRVV